MSYIVDRLKAAGKPMALDDRVWNTITVSLGASIFDEAASAITAYLAALKERGLLTERTESAWNWAFPSGDIVVTYFPALIIRMEQK